MKLNDIVTTEIDDLIAMGERLSRNTVYSETSPYHVHIQELSALTTRGGQLIRQLYGTESQHFHNWQKILEAKTFSFLHSNHQTLYTSQLVGILKAVQHDIKSGMLSDMRLLINAEVFSDFLSMCEHLLSEGYKDPAAVILGAVLEDSLRKLSEKNGITTTQASGKPLMIDSLNIALAKKGIYNSLVQKSVTTWANLRNDAAHGHFDKYDAGQVKQMLLFVQKFCTDYLQ